MIEIRKILELNLIKIEKKLGWDQILVSILN